MSADLCRRAAARARELAEAATIWYPAESHDGMDALPWHTADELASDFDDEQGPHIATWSPTVALLVADWLESHAEWVAEHEECGVGCPVYDAETDPGVAVARELLRAGESS